MPRATRVLELRTLRTQPARSRIRNRVRTAFLQAVDIVDVLEHTGDRVECVRVARLIGARTPVRSTPANRMYAAPALPNRVEAEVIEIPLQQGKGLNRLARQNRYPESGRSPRGSLFVSDPLSPKKSAWNSSPN
jgi:hypothetical protein